jgi:hypothetical protein
MDGAFRHAQPRGKLAPGLFSMSLQQQDRGEQAIGSHRSHQLFTRDRNYDTRWHISIATVDQVQRRADAGVY